MAKPNHHSLAYKMRANPNKTYKELKQKQKARISEWMFQAVSGYYSKHGTMPEGEEAEKIARRVYHKVQSVAIWVPYEEFYPVFTGKLPRFETRLTESRSAEPVSNTVPPAKKSKEPNKEPSKGKTNSTAKNKSRSRKLCLVCGRKMKHQFHGLLHCKCGISWIRGEGFFERTSDMVFALERRRIGKKVKQCPVIRHRGVPEEPDIWEYEEDEPCLTIELPW